MAGAPRGFGSGATAHATSTSAVAMSATIPRAVRAGVTLRPGATAMSDPRRLDDDGRGLDDRDGERSDVETELVHSLGRHERDDAMRARLDVDLRHDAIDLHARDEPREAVARAREHISRVVPRASEDRKSVVEGTS